MQGTVLVDEEALIEALDSGKVKKYVTDFANPLVAGRPGILVTPHLGASTAESEENCAEMAVKEIRQAMYHAVNLDEIVEKAYGGAGYPGSCRPCTARNALVQPGRPSVCV